MGVVNEAPAAFRSSNDRLGPVDLLTTAARDVWSRRRLIGYMVRADVKKRGANTVLGNIWWVLDPLITMLVYVLVMTVIFQRSTPDFPLFLLAAMVPFKWFTATIGNSTGAITGREGLIKQILFPKIILPVTGTLSQIVSWLFGMGVLAFVLVVAYTDHLTIHVIWVPIIAVVQYVFVLGITFIVSAVTVFYRDVGIVIGHFMRLLFWVSPILWSFAAVAGRGQRLAAGLADVDRSFGLPEGTLFAILSYNPVAILLDSYRRVIYGTIAREESTVTWVADGLVVGDEGGGLTWVHASPPDWSLLAIILVSGIVITIVGTIVFKRMEPSFAKVL